MVRRALTLLTLLLTLGCGRAPQPNVADPARLDPPAFATVLPSGYAVAEGSTTDAATGLPSRIVHRASGVVLLLVLAGEFEPVHLEEARRSLEVIGRRWDQALARLKLAVER